MPKVTLTESQKIAARWQTQDEAFRAQFDRIRKLSGMTQERMAKQLGVTVPTMVKYANYPGEMPKKVERRLVLMAERVGVVYDPGLGNGRPKKPMEPPPAGVVLTIDPETGYLRAVTAG